MDWLIDALVDSLKLVPFLFFAYVLIELIETFASKKLSDTKFLKGKFAPAVGSVIGIVPQCGFSVVATDLYSRKKITVGTLIAIFIVTSDEAIPILLSNLTSTKAVINLVSLIGVKFVVGLACGYLIDFLIKLIYKNKTPKLIKADVKTKAIEATSASTTAPAELSEADAEQTDDAGNQQADSHEQHADEIACQHKHEHNHQDEQKKPLHKGCCGHDIEEDKKHPAKQYLLHPLVHTLKVFAYILVINIIFSALIYYVGEENIATFLQSSVYFAPLLACLIGLIPNCASSVVLTNLLVIGGLSFSACVAGLIVNAGIAYLVLFKQNKNQKHNFAIIGTMFLVGVVTGYVLMLFGI